MKTRHTIPGVVTLLLLSQALLVAPAEGQSAPATIEYSAPDFSGQ